ncbi:MAG: hypothetical protein PHW24_00090 [Candidatus Moranbacteria bacterium]|nr:hypothetical protein [Candidatus Moranbacteria bacterium]
MKDLIKETIEKIKDQGIAPEPRWKYLVKKYGMWCVFGIAVFFGSISFSVAFDMLRQLDWDLYRFAHQSAIVYSLSLLPYFWIVLIGIFLTLAFFDLRKTETGYKYGWLKMSLASIGGIVAIGFVFSSVGLGGKFNDTLARDIPYYGQHMMITKESQWMQPENGFLSGTLTAISDGKLEINDLNGQKWNVVLSGKTLIRPAVNVAKGEMIKIIGSKKNANDFEALEIRPWMGQGMMNGSGIGRGGNAMMNGGRGMMNEN